MDEDFDETDNASEEEDNSYFDGDDHWDGDGDTGIFLHFIFKMTTPLLLDFGKAIQVKKTRKKNMWRKILFYQSSIAELQG